jgi:hypothetical protein
MFAEATLKCRRLRLPLFTKLGFVELCSSCVRARPAAFPIETASGPRSCLGCDRPSDL